MPGEVEEEKREEETKFVRIVGKAFKAWVETQNCYRGQRKVTRGTEQHMVIQVVGA